MVLCTKEYHPCELSTYYVLSIMPGSGYSINENKRPHFTELIANYAVSTEQLEKWETHRERKSQRERESEKKKARKLIRQIQRTSESLEFKVVRDCQGGACKLKEQTTSSVLWGPEYDSYPGFPWEIFSKFSPGEFRNYITRLLPKHSLFTWGSQF